MERSCDASRDLGLNAGSRDNVCEGEEETVMKRREGKESGVDKEEDKESRPPDPTYPPNTLLSPSHFPPSPYDPRFMYAGRSEPDLYAAHSRQGSDPYSASPYYCHPYINPIR